MLGILASRAVKSRRRLPEDKYLEFVWRPNVAARRDPEWLDYVNLSIETINGQFFDIASGNWHRGMDGFWCVVAFDPAIMTHPDVHFATTNWLCTVGVRRAPGRAGLEALYVPRVHQYSDRYVERTPQHSAARPTCPQAEVLYPGELSTNYIQRIYVQNDDAAATIEAQCEAVGHSPVEVLVRPDALR